MHLLDRDEAIRIPPRAALGKVPRSARDRLFARVFLSPSRWTVISHEEGGGSIS